MSFDVNLTEWFYKLTFPTNIRSSPFWEVPAIVRKQISLCYRSQRTIIQYSSKLNTAQGSLFAEERPRWCEFYAARISKDRGLDPFLDERNKVFSRFSAATTTLNPENQRSNKIAVFIVRFLVRIGCAST